MRKNQAPFRKVPLGIRAYIRTHPLGPPSGPWSTSSSLDLDTDTLSPLDGPSTLSLASSHWSIGSRPQLKRRYSELWESRMKPESKRVVEPIYLETRRPGIRRLGEAVPFEPYPTGKRTSGQGTHGRRSQPERLREFVLVRPMSRGMSTSPSTQHRDPSPRMTGAGPSTPPRRPTVHFQEPNSWQHRSPQSSRPARTQSPVPEREPPPRGVRFAGPCGHEDRGSSTQTYRRVKESDRYRRPRRHSTNPQVVSRSPQSQSDVRVEERYPRSSSEPLPDIVRNGHIKVAGSTWFTANGSQFKPERVRL